VVVMACDDEIIPLQERIARSSEKFTNGESRHYERQIRRLLPGFDRTQGQSRYGSKPRALEGMMALFMQ